MGQSRVWWIGGVVAGAVMIAFGIAVIALAINGQHSVKSELKNQQITGTPDMTPAAIKAEAEKAGLKNVDLPTCSVAGEAIDTGTKARCFAQYMNVHALEATGGYVGIALDHRTGPVSLVARSRDSSGLLAVSTPTNYYN